MSLARNTLILLGMAALAACGSGGSQRGAPPPATVGVLTIAPQQVRLQTELPGRTVAYRIAQVRPQVSGIVQKRLFTEGAYVREGQPLYQLDAGPYQAAYDSAKANVSKAEANLQTAQLRYDRAQRLVAIGAVSTQDRDDASAALQQANADLETARAQQRAASINLAYTRISSPIAGRTATSTVTEGALVTANQAQELTTVQQLDPIYVDLTQSSAQLMKLRSDYAASGIQRRSDGKAVVQLLLEDGSTYEHDGLLEFTGVTVSESTGAVTLRAVFPNPQGQLLPGMYVRAEVEEGTDARAILAPQAAVSRNDKGEPTALVVGADDKVEQRVLSTADTIGSSWRVLSGLAPGDRLIVDGLQNATVGAVVVPRELVAEKSGNGANTPGAAP